MTEHILKALFSCSKHYDLYSVLTEFIHYVCDQVKAFLICQTGNDSDQHRIRVFIQSKIFLKLDLILNFFLTESLCIVVSGNTFICFRIEYIIINSIDNTSKIMCSGTEKTIQTFSIERSFDFFRISITYRSYCISKNNSTFQEVCIFVCFQFIRCKIIIRKSCDSLNSLYIPYSLEFQIVNCHNCLDSPEKFILLEGIMQIYRNKTCLPVVTVDHIRAETDNRKDRQYSL